ncbi:MAG: ribosome silencing factor [Acidobacteria bacterium]|nr:ribosome silencing factor [Acidobacteriota bacterium]
MVEVEPAPVKAVSLSVDEEILDQVRMAVAAAEEKKAENIVALRLSALTEFTDYFIICTGNSTRQTQAIADEVTAQLKKNYRLRPLNTEGYTSGEWILIDFGAFVLHVFTETSRSFYDLERLWRDAEVVRF